jgi:hypothetical protein
MVSNAISINRGILLSQATLNGSKYSLESSSGSFSKERSGFPSMFPSFGLKTTSFQEICYLLIYHIIGQGLSFF